MREPQADVNGYRSIVGANLAHGALFALEADVQGEQSAVISPVPFALGVVPWRQGGVLNVTVVVKATFAAKTSPMSPASAPQPYRISDAHHKNQPMARVTSPSDRVPKKSRVDVTVLGHAHATRGLSVPEMSARFALKQRETLVIDKAVRVVGARMSEGGAPVPFVRMPIVYERAFGGITTAENPIGCGEEGDDDDHPNILNPKDSAQPIGFGPISSAWPVRKKKLGQTPARDVESPLMVLPNEFDFSYFQCAPPDQQIDELASDATLILEGFDPERACVEVALPGARALGAIYGLNAADPEMGTPIDFRADALHVDADSWTATMTFRGHVAISDESRLDQIVVATGIGIGGVDPVIPSMRPPADRIKPAAELSPATTGDLAASNMGGTLMIGNESASPNPALPFAPGHAQLATRGKKRSSETLILPLSAWSQGPTRHLSTATLVLPPSSSDAGSVEPTVVPPRAAPVVAPGPLPIAPPPLLPSLPSAEPTAPSAVAVPTVVSIDEPPRRPEEVVDIERYGFVSALLEQRGAKREHVLKNQSIDPSIWRKAERHWRAELKREMADGIVDNVPRFEEAFVQGWETLHPDHFGVEHYARLTLAEKQSRIVRELKSQGIEPSLGMRLRRVWRRRVQSDSDLSQAFEALVNGEPPPSSGAL